MATRKKYKIVLSEKYVRKSENGKEWFRFPVNISGQLVAIQTIIPLDPYTEPDMEQVRKEAYDKGYENGFIAGHLKAEKSGQSFYEDGHQRGLNDAWEAARKIIHMPEADLLNLFTECYSAVCTSVQVFLKYDVSECIEKIRQYEQEREMDGLRQNIQTIVDKCGYSLDEIAEVLQKMRES